MTLGVAILVIGMLALLLFSRAFRKIAAVALGLLLVAALVLYLWLEASSREQRRKQELAKGYIKSSEIEVVEPTISFSSYDRSPDRITGRIRNNSRYGLRSVELRLLFEDCPPAEKCETVGEAKEEIYIQVPSGQSRDFNHFISGHRISPRGRLQWSYAVLSITADIP